jgi:hypothetical protein
MVRSRLIAVLVILLVVLVATAGAEWYFEEIAGFTDGDLTAPPAVHFSPQGELHVAFINIAPTQELWLYNYDGGWNSELVDGSYAFDISTIDFGFDDQDPAVPILVGYDETFGFAKVWQWIDPSWETATEYLPGTAPTGIDVSVEEHQRGNVLRFAAQVFDTTDQVVHLTDYDKTTRTMTLDQVESYPSTADWSRVIYNDVDGLSYVIYSNLSLFFERETELAGTGNTLDSDIRCYREFDAAAGLNELFAAYYDDVYGLIKVYSANASDPDIWYEMPDLGMIGLTYPIAQTVIDVHTVGGEDYPQIVFIADDGGGNVFYHARFNGAEWMLTHLGDADGTITNYLDFELDENGHPWIAHYHANGTYDDTVRLIYNDNFQPDSFGLIYPEDLQTVYTGQPSFEWEVSLDFEDSQVNYELYIDSEEAFPDPIILDAGTGTTYTPTSDESLRDGVYYWKVRAADSGGEDTFSLDTWLFAVAADDFPEIESATAEDQNGEQGIQDLDRVVFVFSEQVNPDVIDASNIEDYLPLPDGHTWLDGDGQIYNATWSRTNLTDDTLTIRLSTSNGAPSVAVGDEIDLSTAATQFTDLTDQPVTGSVIIGGSFGPAGPEFDIAYDYLETLEYAQDNRIGCGFAGGADVDSCELYYSRGGFTDWNIVAMTEDTDDWYHTLPAAEVMMEGLVYAFHAFDSDGNESWYPEDFATGGHLHANTHAAVFTPEELSFPPGDGVEDYVLLCCPLEMPADRNSPDEQLGDDFGGAYDPSRWRMFGWYPGGGQYEEYDPPSENLTLEPGPGFWIIVRDGAASIDLEDCRSLKPDPAAPFMIQVEPGWNLIGNPYSFTVSWDDCYTDDPSSVTQLPITYSDGSYSYDQTELVGGTGYWIYAEFADNLFIPAVGVAPTAAGDEPARLRSSTDTTASSSSTGGGLPALEVVESRVVPAVEGSPPPGATAGTAEGWGDPGHWRMAFTLRSDEAADVHHLLGVDPAASDYHDALECREAPPLPGLPSLWFEHDDWPARRGSYATDLRRPYETGSAWAFYCAAEGTAELSWHIENGWPGGFGALLELPDGRVVDLLSTSRVTLDESLLSSGLPLRVYVGTEEYLGDEFAARGFTLAQSYPNPADGLIRIEYELPEAGAVELAVYDLAGRRVATLHSGEQTAGRHTVSWNAAEAAPGVYLYRLSADEGSLTRRLVVDR